MAQLFIDTPRQPQQALTAPAARSIRGSDLDAATEALLADVDATSDWLADECCFKKLTPEQRVVPFHRLAEQPAYVLWAAALLAADRGDMLATFEAMRLLKDRYLHAKDAALLRRAGEIAAEVVGG